MCCSCTHVLFWPFRRTRSKACATSRNILGPGIFFPLPAWTIHDQLILSDNVTILRNRHGVYQRYLCNGFACSLSLMLVFQHQLETSSAAILLPSNDEPRTHDGSAASEHIVLIGNSLTRYQFLSLAYLIFRGTKTPNYIVPEKTSTPGTTFSKTPLQSWRIAPLTASGVTYLNTTMWTINFRASAKIGTVHFQMGCRSLHTFRPSEIL